MSYRAIFLILFAASSIAADGCSPAKPPPPVGGTDARAACARGAALGCASLGPTPSGVACETWLGAAPVSSVYTACVASAADCDAVSVCR